MPHVTWGSEAEVRWGRTASRAQITLQHGTMAQESFCFAPTKHLSWLQSRLLMQGQVSGEQAPDVCAVRGGGGSTDPATLVGDVNHQEVNNLPAEAWGGCWLQ